MKSLILAIVAILALSAFASVSEAACWRGKLGSKAKQRAGAVMRFILPPYGR